MGLKTALPLALAAMLALTCANATAQPTPPAAAAQPAYSDAQMSAFARATVALQALGAQDPDAQTRTIEASGLQVEDYNRMGDAMRADPALAASLTPYLDRANAERTAAITRIPPNARNYGARNYSPRRYASHARHAVGASRHAHGKHHRATHVHRGHRTIKTTRHTSSRHHHTATTHHHATAHHTRHRHH